ncbi:hypothetical protein L1987_16814 [Smallanthus sonchifolius]|uniref:Uncharacterized protein n=1 Tax=Smallanthus sonchifolius TaxID=185202 RepID=A0ACB9IV42_9ASTR|nr:hypothetical protein L1987_16814 [Smallanthus sonchifolius]
MEKVTDHSFTAGRGGDLTVVVTTRWWFVSGYGGDRVTAAGEQDRGRGGFMFVAGLLAVNDGGDMVVVVNIFTVERGGMLHGDGDRTGITVKVILVLRDGSEDGGWLTVVNGGGWRWSSVEETMVPLFSLRPRHGDLVGAVHPEASTTLGTRTSSLSSHSPFQSIPHR